MHGLAPGSSLRVLSRDDIDGACTCLWQIPPGWRQDAAFTLEGASSWFVLAGELCSGDVTVPTSGYRRVPAGATHEPLATTPGALVLAMWDRGPRLLAPGSVAQDVSDACVACFATAEVESQPTPVAGPVPGITVKLLHRSSATGGVTALVTIPAGWTEPRFEHHDCVEESFKISGEIRIVEDGVEQVLAAGDYFFRPPYIKHGAMHTPAGTSSLIRFSGTVVNHYGPVPEGRRAAAGLALA
jgi:quercetin dioxygenase-like cupin family protein